VLSLFYRVGRVYDFLTRLAVYPLLPATLLALGLFAGRVYLSGHLTYAFLVWNLFLAWIPYLFSLWVVSLHRTHPGHWWYVLIPGSLWLLFFPNAPYILTDFFHFRTRLPIPVWYDVGMLSAFAWTGLFLAIFSLRNMQSVVRDLLGPLVSWLFVLGSLGLGGLGVYIGRFLRWNSWDLVVQPYHVLSDVLTQLASPRSHPGAFGVTLLFAAFLLVCYLTLTPLRSIPNLDSSLS
jgi:uncharacterized membrane protein